jgi:hypothetical protein
MDGVDGWMEGRQNGVRGNEERMKDDEEGSKGMMEWWWWKVEREVQRWREGWCQRPRGMGLGG